MGKGKIKLKKFLIIFLLIAFLFQATYAFALEIKYPSVPGAITPQEIEQKLKAGEIEKEDVLPLYFKYYFNLSLIIVVLICLGVLIFGATLFLLSPAKPVVLVSAKRWIFSGLLGLLILFSSYLVLVTINPQLSLLRLGREEAEVPPGRVAPLPREAITYFEVPTGRLIEENLSHITAITTRTILINGISHWPDCDRGKSDCWEGDRGLPDKVRYSFAENLALNCQWRDFPDDCQDNEVMGAIKWPECDGGQMACWGGQTQIKCCGPVKLTDCYTTNTPSCKKGEVLRRITRWPNCQGGKTDCWDDQQDEVECCTPDNFKLADYYTFQRPVVEGPVINKYVAELEKVKARSENLQDKLELLNQAAAACSCGTSNCEPDSQVYLSHTECWCEPEDEDNPCDIDCDKEAIMAAASSTKQAIAKLEAERMKMVTMQIPIVIDYLEMKKAGLLMELPEDEIDYGEFAFQRFLLDKEGRQVETETFEGWPSPLLTRKVEGEKVSVIDPATFYFDPDTWENQQAKIETQRLNPILIFSNTSPKELNDKIAEIVKEVLGVDVFNLISESDWEEIVRKSLEEGTVVALEDFLDALAGAVSKAVAEKLPQNLIEKSKKISLLFEEKLALIAIAQAQEPDPLTEKLAEFFTTKLEDRLPPLLKKTLSGDILDFVDQITGGDIKKIFTTKFYDLLSQDLQDLLSTKMADLSPELSRLLALRVVEVFPFAIMVDLLTEINDFLIEQINKIKEAIWKQVDIIVKKVVDAITNALLKALPEFLEEIILALMEGIEIVIAEIAKGYVEMYIMYEFDSFFKDVYKFQEKLDDLLKLTIRDILPKEIKKFLKKTVKDLVPEDVQDFLDESFIERLPEETQKFLTKSLKKFLPEEIRDILDESLASLLGIEFVFEKTLYDYFPERLKEIFEKGWWSKLLTEARLSDPLIEFLPDSAQEPFVELSQEQRRKLFLTSILNLFKDSPLKKTPLEVLEREDDKVMDLLDPDVKLLVRIIEDYLKPEERPELVNELIRILKKSLTDFIRDELNNPELARILNTPLYKNYPQEVQDALHKSFADHFSELFDLLFDPSTDTLIDIIDKHADSNLSQILRQSTLDLLPSEIRDQFKIRLKDFLPDWITDKKLFELLPESWLGSIADFLGLTDQDIDDAIDETMEEIELDEEVNRIIQTMSQRMADAFTESLIENIAEKTGERISEEKADELTEKISEEMSVLVEKAWTKVLSEGFMLDSLENL